MLYILATWWTTLLGVLAPEIKFLVFVLMVRLMALSGSKDASTSIRGGRGSVCSSCAVLTLLTLGTVTLTNVMLGRRLAALLTVRSLLA